MKNVIEIKSKGGDNANHFNQGEIVYWCHRKGHEYSVHWGMVDEQFSDVVIIDYISPRERRKINGVPIDEFESETHYRKLPKGWGYETQLFNITVDDLSDVEKQFGITDMGVDINNPKLIKDAYDKGYYVKDSSIFHGYVEAEIDKNLGYRLVKKYPMWTHHISSVSIKPYKLYRTYEEAKCEVNKNTAELYRQSSLSEYDWSVEKIDEVLEYYKCLADISDNEIKRYRDWLLELDRVEDIEIRVSHGNLQWKYWKNKCWLNIEL